MAHVQIKSGEGVDGLVRIIVDGHDISNDTLVEGFTVSFPQTDAETACVSVVIAADVLDIDLPEAVVEAMRQEGDQ